MATRFELRHAPLTRVTAFAAPTIEFLLFGIIVAYGDTSPESAAAFASLLMIASLLHSWFVFGSRYELNSSTLRIVHGPWRRAVPLADMLGARPLRTLDRGAIRAAPPRLQARAPPHATRSRCVPRRARGAGPLPRGARDRVRNPVPELAPRSPRSREPGTPTRGGFVIPAGGRQPRKGVWWAGGIYTTLQTTPKARPLLNSIHSASNGGRCRTREANGGTTVLGVPCREGSLRRRAGPADAGHPRQR